jgi:glycosyltransferase involved in cell wall biosynthesis
MIRIAAHARGEDGWGRHSRGLAGALARRERTELVDFQDLGAARPSFWRRLSPSRRSSVGICLGEAHRTFSLDSRYRVAYHVGETTRIPRDTLFLLQRADMVWTPSQWGRGILEANGVEAGRIGVTPEGVDCAIFRPPDGPRARSLPFRFLCVAKWEERKGTADLVQAFLDEFRAGEAVELVMRCDRPGDAAADSRIVWTGPVDLAGLVVLMQSCDAFVLPTRGEGWGLPVLEAMACELPCIVTGYSGVTEFAHEGNAFLIRVAEMCPVDDPRYYDVRHDWGDWARPDRDHLRSLMRLVFEDREEAARRAKRAREEAAAMWTWERAAEAAMRHVRSLRNGGGR